VASRSKKPVFRPEIVDSMLGKANWWRKKTRRIFGQRRG
jgi:hypothetical protein